ncbi:MAG TPA: PAS domain S-box protein, partial [Anaerolineaceae bacterium]|nr:PAS domain S-box protein [Anaerolineaceae bacterium]
NHEQVRVLIQHLTETESAIQALTTLPTGEVNLPEIDPGSNLLQKVQEVLQQSNELLEKIFSSIHNCIAYMDRDFNFIRVNRAYAQMDDREPGDFIGKNHFELYPNSENLSIFQNVVDTGEPFYAFERPFAYAAHPERGTTYWDWSLSPILNPDGKVSGLLLNLINVTSRVVTAQALRDSQSLAQRLFESAPDAYILTDSDGRILETNPQVEAQFGYTREELLGQSIEMLIPERFRGQHIAHRARYYLSPRTRPMGNGLNLSGRRKSGEDFPVDITLTPMKTENTVQVLSVIRDITSRRQTEAALREKTEYVRLLQDIAVASNEAQSSESALQYALNRICQHTGWPMGHAYLLNDDKTAMVSSRIWHIASTEDSLPFRIQSENQPFPPGFGLPGTVMRDGLPAWIKDVTNEAENFSRKETAGRAGLRAAFAFPVLIGKETVGVLEFFSTQPEEPNSALLEVMRHIGAQLGRVIEREQNHKRLEKQETLLRTVLDTLPVGVWIADENGKIISANREGMRIWGGTKDMFPEEIGKFKARRLDTQEVIHPEEWGISKAIATREASLDELLEIETADGTHRIVYNSALPLQDAQQRIIGAVAVNQDITERRKLEAELGEVQRRLLNSVETERSRLAQDLHDGPIQDLYGIAFQLQALESLTADAEGQSTITRAEEMLQKVISSLRSTMGELKPPSLAHFGLEKAIRSHAETFQEQNQELQVHLDLDRDNNALTDQERLVFYRNYQQFMTNVVRHAHAHNVWVRLRLDPNRTVLEVQDDGKGFTEPKRWIDLARKGHLGLAGASERAESLAGYLEIHSAPGKGALLRTLLPHHMKGKSPKA